MRVRAAVLVTGLLASGCAGAHGRIAHPSSLRELAQLPRRGTRAFGVIVDAKSGRALAAFQVDRPIRTAIDDGHGGWYVGGGFTRLDRKPHRGLAHIRADGIVDPDWRPEASSATSLARLGSRLFVAGVRLSAIDARTGKLDPSWKPDEARPFWRNVLLPAGKRLIVGGGGGLPVSAIVALDAATGKRDRSWHGNVEASGLEGGGVYLLALDGPHLLVGGTFSAVDGVPRSGLAALDADTGALDRAWAAPNVGGDTFFAIAPAADRIFASLNGPARYQLVALDADTGKLDRRWHARLGFTAGIFGGSSGLALARAGGRVYVAGTFDSVDRVRREGFAALDADSARVLPSWSPRAATVYGSVIARSGSRLLVGIQLSREVQFDFAGLKTYVPVRRLHLLLALSGAGSTRIGIGTGCPFERWTETGHCAGRVSHWLATVAFPSAGRRRFTYGLCSFQGGRSFVRFVPRAAGGPPQPPWDLPFDIAC